MYHRKAFGPQPGQPAAEASGSVAVSRRRSWLPAPESPHKAPRATPAREARDGLLLAHAVWRRPSGCCGSSAAGELSPRDDLFSEFPWSAWERASHRSGGSPPPRARGMAAHAEAAPRAVAPPAADAGGPWERQAARRRVGAQRRGGRHGSSGERGGQYKEFGEPRIQPI